MPLTPNPDYRLNRPFSTQILTVLTETSTVKTLRVKYNPIPEPITCYPGQFVMVWIPGVDEIPMSISHFDKKGHITISVAKVGEATEALCNLRVGDYIGIRGPYGNWYSPQNGTAIVVGGGIGMASVLPLIYQLNHLRKHPSSVHIDKFICIEGAKTEEELIFAAEIQELFVESAVQLHFCTDDGSCGFKGFTTDKLDHLLAEELANLAEMPQNSPITVYTCGPEPMLKKVVNLCHQHGIAVQASLERMMRCGFGLCGLCALEPTGYLVCKDGPIFSGETLQQVTDFGMYHRDMSGKPHNI